MKRRICFVITRMIAGGAQKVLLDLVEQLDNETYDIHLVSGTETGHEGSMWKRLEALLDEKHIHRCPSLVRRVNPLLDTLAIFQLKKIFLKIKPDIVHTHTSKAGVLGRLVAHWLKVEKIVHSTHGSIYDQGSKIPGVSGKSLLIALFKKVDRFVGFRTHRVITLSEVETGQTLKLNLCPPQVITCIANGIPLEDFSKIQRFRDSKEPLKLGIAGRLNKEKGHELLLDAMVKIFRKYPKITLEIAGSGPLEKTLKAYSKKLKLDERVHFHGHQEDMVAFLASIDIFVLSSHYEGFGLVLVEAMAAGLPVVATDVGGVREVVGDGLTGLVIPRDSSSDLAMGVEYFLENPRLAEEFGKRGRALAMEKYSVKHMVEAHHEIYEQKTSLEPLPLEMSDRPSQVDLHIHTHHSFDSHSKIEDIFEQALDQKLRAIAITDHDNVDGAIQACQMAPQNLMVIPGVEVTSDVGDIIGLFVHKPIVSRKFKDVIAEIRSQGGVVYLPHPFRGRQSLAFELLELIDIVETVNGRSRQKGRGSRQFSSYQESLELAQDTKKTGIGSSDAHSAGEVGIVRTHLPQFNDEDQLKNILLSGIIFPVSREGSWLEETLVSESPILSSS